MKVCVTVIKHFYIKGCQWITIANDFYIRKYLKMSLYSVLVIEKDWPDHSATKCS